jgi:hypothetical protein
MLVKNAAGEMKRRRGWRAAGALALTVIGLTTIGGEARAAAFINRGLNLPRDTWELGLGAGIGHIGAIDYTGFGLNLELGYGLNSTVELRARTGIRVSQSGRSTQADRYGRPVETETYNTGIDTLANPELGLRFNLVRGGTAEIAFDARVQLPFDPPLGLTLGLPIALHLGKLRLDTGVFMPIRFHDNTAIDVSIPLHFWIKLSGGNFIGPMTGVVWQNDAGTRVPFGIGAGTPLAYDADIRFWLLFLDIGDSNKKDFGGGVGLYVQF